MQINIVSIYSDPEAVYSHDPNFGNMECGQRVNINRMLYAKNGYRIVCPKPKSIYFKVLEQVHGKNPLLKMLRLNNLVKNATRNCHACTTETTDEICQICQTKFVSQYHFKYAFTLDTNIIDSDTTYVTPATLLTVKNAVSLVCQMIDDLVSKKTNHGFAIVRPPGHHACHNKSGGFCIVNNVAVAAEYAIKLGCNRVFIFDFDAHHGDGTQKIFYQRKDVFYCSMHTNSFYPTTGSPSEMGDWPGYCHNLNILVPKDVDDKTYLEIFRSNVLMTIAAFKPDIILVSAGFDGLATDPMKIMKLTVNCYGKMIDNLMQFNVPIGLILEGGYNLEELSKCYDICLKSLYSCY